MTTRFLDPNGKIKLALILHSTRCGRKHNKGSELSTRRTRHSRSAEPNKKLRQQKIVKRFFGQSPFLSNLSVFRTLTMQMTTANLKSIAAPV